MRPTLLAAVKHSMEEEKRTWGLNYARSLNFTDEQYDEAVKRIDSLDNANQLLVALIDVSSRDNNQVQTTQVVRPTTVTSTTTTNIVDPSQLEVESSLSSCYSSITSFPSSSDRSLDSLQEQHTQFDLGLRKIYIDGSNVAKTHGRNVSFSWAGIRLCIDWFRKRNHQVKVFVPVNRCNNQPKAESVINYLKQINALVETPIDCNDDLFIIDAAVQNNGVIVSNDLYRDEKSVKEEWKHFVNLNRLPYIFVDDLFMPANDPRGRCGPTLDEFLRETCDYAAGSTHNKLYRTKSNQRYQRSGFYPKQSHHNFYHRSLQPTRSCPMEYTQAVNTDTYSNRNHHHHQPQQQQHHHKMNLDNSAHTRQQVKKTISISYGNPNTTAKDNNVQPIFGHKSALCRTKSHNM